METRTIGGETWAMEYGTSLLGRQLSYKDVLGQTQTYDYYKMSWSKLRWGPPAAGSSTMG